MTRSTLGILIGLALGLTVAFGSFGQMLIVALFAAIGFVVAKVLDGGVDLIPYLSRPRGPMTDQRCSAPVSSRSTAGRTELGMISISDRVVEKIAGLAPLSRYPDAGGRRRGSWAARCPVRALGVRPTSLTAPPKARAASTGRS